MKTCATLLLVACGGSVPRHAPAIAPATKADRTTLPATVVAATEPTLPDYGGGDADFAHLPRVQVAQSSIAKRHLGGTGTSFRYVRSLMGTTWVITVSNVGPQGPRLYAQRTDQDVRAPLTASARSPTTSGATSSGWSTLLRSRDCRRRRPLRSIGSTDYAMTFTMATPEGDARVNRTRSHYEDDNFQYVLVCLRQLAGDGF